MSNVTESSDSIHCALCGVPAVIACPVCAGEAYCGEKCQVAHWVQHAAECNTQVLENVSEAVAMPFNLVDEDNNDLEFRVMPFYRETAENLTVGTILRSENLDSYETVEIGENLVARSRRKKDLGYGRKPTADEMEEIAEVIVNFVPANDGEDIQQDYHINIGKNTLYEGNQNPAAKRPMFIKRRFGQKRPDGLIYWVDPQTISDTGVMEITTHGWMTVTVQRGKDEYSISFAVRNLRPLRWGLVKRVTRFGSWWDKQFKTGVTGRRLLKAKGFEQTSRHFPLTVHSYATGMQVALVLRIGDGNFAELVDLEVYVRDNMKPGIDKQTDVDALMKVSNLVVGNTEVYEGDTDDITAICMSLKDHIAREQMDLTTFQDFGDDEINQEIAAGVEKCQKHLDTLVAYQKNLEDGKDPDYTREIGIAISEARQALEIGGKLRQRRWQRRIEGKKGLRLGGLSGMDWAETKQEEWSENPKDNKSKLTDLYKALQNASLSGASSRRREVLLSVLRPQTSRSIPLYKRAIKKAKKTFSRKGDDEDEYYESE